MGITGAAALVSAGTAAYGAYEKSEGNAKQEQAALAQSQAAAVQNAISIQQTQLQSQYAISQSALQASYQTGQAQQSAQFAAQQTALNIEGAQASLAATESSVAINKSIIQASQNIEAQRMQAMELDARRKQMDNLRIAQRTRALATISATSQGALFGSGISGGRAAIQGQTGVNQLGIQQNLQLGRNIFAQNAAITQGRIASSDLQLSLARQQASLQTRDAQLKSLYAQTQADTMSSYYATNAAAQAQYSQQNASLTTAFAGAGGTINTAQGQIAAGQGQSQFGGSLISAAPTILSAGVTANNVFPNLFSNTNYSGTEGGSPAGIPEQA